MVTRSEIEQRLGPCRKVQSGRHYYDCPECKVKDPQGNLVVEWDKDKFICNHGNSCGFAGTISKSLTYTLGFRYGDNPHQNGYRSPKPEQPKRVYRVGEITPVEFKIERDMDKYVPANDRIQQLKALFHADDDLVACIDENYGNLIPIKASALEYAPENYTHIKVNAGGSKAEDIKDLRYTLVECDEIADLKIQGGYIKKLNLPVASLTWSGNKSLHAIVKVEADNMEEYKRRVELIHEVCDSVGFKIDKTKDCCRFTRLAGSKNTAKNKTQRLLEVNTGATNWNEWEQKVLPTLIVTENVQNTAKIEAKDVLPGFSSGFITHDYNDSGLKGGDVTLLTGQRNQGKTTFSRQLVLAAALQEIKSLVWYGEGDKEVEKGYLARLVALEGEIVTQDNTYHRTTWKAGEKAIQRFNSEYAQFIDMYVKPLNLQIPVFNDLISKMTDKARTGTRLFIIDNMMKLTADQARPLDAQKRIIMELKAFAINYDAHVVLICHPRKGEGDQSVSGAMEQENTADTILRFKRGLAKFPEEFPELEKNKITACVLNEKVRNGGKSHTMFMEFDEVRQANIEVAYHRDILHAADSYYQRSMFSRAARKTQPSNDPF